MNSEITDMEEERRWFEPGTKAGMRYLVARVDDKVVGGASIHPQTDKRAHVAEFGISIREGYPNTGIGSALTAELIEIAKQPEFEILQLSVCATNKRALHVYKKCGFKESGRLTRDIKFFDGTYSDTVLMQLSLTEI
jgi:RimJ/RimL family protein N-acetyltransferase